MMNLFVLQDGRLSPVAVAGRAGMDGVAPVWVDLADPGEQERAWVASAYGLAAPRTDATEGEASARY